MSLYIEPFLRTFLLCVGFIVILKLSFRGFGERNRRESRHKYSKQVSRLGGVAIILSFVLSIFLDNHLVVSSQILGIVAASLAILIFGVIDDYWELDWRAQLFFQIAMAMLIFVFGARIEYISNPLGGVIDFGNSLSLSFSLVVLWVVFLMNSMNWLDGVDGLSGGVSLIAVITIFFLSLKPEVNQPPVGIICMILTGAFLAFLIFNFHPAKIMAGTSGSMFMGLVLAALSIFAGAKIATTLFVLSVVIVDVFSVVFQRLKRKKSIFVGDNSHLHYKFLELGWSQKKTSLFFYAMTVVVGATALNTKGIEKALMILATALIIIAIIITVERKINDRKNEHV